MKTIYDKLTAGIALLLLFAVMVIGKLTGVNIWDLMDSKEEKSNG